MKTEALGKYGLHICWALMVAFSFITAKDTYFQGESSYSLQRMFWSSPCSAHIWRACRPCCVLAGAVSVPQMTEMIGHTHSTWTMCFPVKQNKEIRGGEGTGKNKIILLSVSMKGWRGMYLCICIWLVAMLLFYIQNALSHFCNLIYANTSYRLL